MPALFIQESRQNLWKKALRFSRYLDILYTCYANYAKAQPACSCSTCWQRAPCTGSSSPRRCAERTNGVLPFKEGTLYPALYTGWKLRGW